VWNRTPAALAVLLGLAVSLLPAPASAGEVPSTPSNVSVLGRHWQSPHVTVRWDGEPEDLGYDLRVSRTDSRRAQEGRRIRPDRLQGVTGARVRLPVRSGTTICVAVRAHTEGGGTSAWTPTQCWARAYGVGRLARRGHVSVVRNDRMWGGRGLVTRGDGRAVLRRVPRGVHVGFVVTEPDGNGSQRGYRFLFCNGQEIGDTSQPGDDVDYNEVVDLAVPTRRAPCRLVYRRLQHTESSFPLQAIQVFPSWA
jgi:hypothetical protein